MKKELLRIESLNKSYKNKKILKNISFTVLEGETIAILGTNGAGKSTLVKIFAGLLSRDSGKLFFCEQEIEHFSLQKAKSLHIQSVFDYGNTIDSLTIAENIFLSHKKPFPFYPGSCNAAAKKYMDLVNLNREPGELAADLSFQEKAKVQLAAALTDHPKLLLLEELPLFLSSDDKLHIKHLFEKRKEQGTSTLYITHNLDDAILFADRIMILQNGTCIYLTDKKELSKELLTSILSQTNSIAGYSVSLPQERTVLEVTNLHSSKLSDIHFQVKAGEILGFIGSADSGNVDILDALFGLTHTSNSKLRIEGIPVKIKNTKDAVQNGISYASNRHLKQSDLRPGASMTVMDNISLRSLQKIRSCGLINRQMEQHFATTYLKHLQDKNITITTPVSHLSSGTIYKLQMAQCISTNPKILLLYEPANSIDAASKQELFHTITELAAKGTSILIAISTLSDDTIKLCHRIIVMRNGIMKGELSHQEITTQNILSLEKM